MSLTADSSARVAVLTNIISNIWVAPKTANQEEPVSWTADGHALTYINGRGNLSNIWLQPVDGGQPRQLTGFRTDRIFSFCWSRDGKWLAASRGVVNNDVVLISNFR